MFILKINSTIKLFNTEIETVSVDDFSIFCQCLNIIIERKIQKYLNKIQRWANENGLIFFQNQDTVHAFLQ